ncbi:MAG: response regulator [Bacteroidota bacterium]
MGYKYVLYIDDDEEDLEIFFAVTKEFNNEINFHSFTSASKALKKIISGELLPEIIFIDLNMPGMDGFEFLTEIKKQSDIKIPVVVLSTSSQPSTKQNVEKLGADGYITKPNSIREFVRLLKPYIG